MLRKAGFWNCFRAKTESLGELLNIYKNENRSFDCHLVKNMLLQNISKSIRIKRILNMPNISPNFGREMSQQGTVFQIQINNYKLYMRILLWF